MFKSFNIDNIYNLVETSYSQDFIKKLKKKKKLIWYFNYNIMLLICQNKVLQTIYIFYIYTHIIWIF